MDLNSRFVKNYKSGVGRNPFRLLKPSASQTAPMKGLHVFYLHDTGSWMVNVEPSPSSCRLSTLHYVPSKSSESRICTDELIARIL